MKVDFLTWFISAFCCYRLTVLVARDLGPWNVFDILRRDFKMLKCPYCVSIYAGSLVAFGLFVAGFDEPLVMWIILSFSFSASSIVLDRCFSADWNPKP